MKMKDLAKICLSLVLVSTALVSLGCTKPVPAGTKGQVKTAKGWKKKLVPPGRISCWGRDELWLVETRDLTTESDLKVLLQKERVNFGVKIAMTFTLKDDQKNVLPVFDKVRPVSKGEAKLITLEGIYNTYAAPVLKSVPRQLIRNYDTDTLLTESGRIEKEVQTAVVQELQNTPIKVRRVAIVNMDFPEFITRAQERAKEAEIRIREEENKQKARLVQEENKRKLAEIQYQTAVLEAKKIADSNRLIGQSLTGTAGQAYLRWHEIKVYGDAAKGPNNCIFLPMEMFRGSSDTSGIAYEASMTPAREVLRENIIGKDDEQE
jgi:hypothetical protein